MVSILCSQKGNGRFLQYKKLNTQYTRVGKIVDLQSAWVVLVEVGEGGTQASE